jgi:hypothetical protein
MRHDDGLSHFHSRSCQLIAAWNSIIQNLEFDAAAASNSEEGSAILASNPAHRFEDVDSFSSTNFSSTIRRATSPFKQPELGLLSQSPFKGEYLGFKNAGTQESRRLDFSGQ